jgi:hypothetical protein
MTEGQVDAIFGCPADRVPTVHVSMTFPGPPIRFQKNWSGREGIAVVAFSPEGTVVLKALVQPPEVGWLDRLRRWLGL